MTEAERAVLEAADEYEQAESAFRAAMDGWFARSIPWVGLPNDCPEKRAAKRLEPIRDAARAALIAAVRAKRETP